MDAEYRLVQELRRLAASAFGAVARGELAPRTQVVQAIAAAIQAVDGPAPAAPTPVLPSETPPRSALERRDDIGRDGRDAAGPEEGSIAHALGVAARMRTGRSFADACQAQAIETGVGLMTVRNACCRAFGLVADDWNAWGGRNRLAGEKLVRRIVARHPDFAARLAAAFQLG